jgi:predicted lipoprotein with Yx(FWY)xxD motif
VKITRTITPVTGSVILGLVATACGGASSGGSGAYGAPANPPANPPANAPTGTAIGVASLGPGRALVDGSGRAVYLFEKDVGPSSTCSGACASVWPPLLTHGETPTVTGSAGADQLGTTPRGDGGVQVTYHGHPLYYYVSDHANGDVGGQGLNQFGAKWYLVQPSGEKLDTD